MVTIHIVRTLVCTLFIMYQAFHFSTNIYIYFAVDGCCFHSFSLHSVYQVCFCSFFLYFCQSRTRPIKFFSHMVAQMCGHGAVASYWLFKIAIVFGMNMQFPTIIDLNKFRLSFFFVVSQCHAMPC